MPESGEPLGEQRPVALRTVWPDELAFSRWLAENIDILNDQLGWDLDQTSVQQEVPRGRLRVDLLAEATGPETGERFPVVIENQLGMTDGSHLAGVMTYMVTFGAKGAIWIAGDVSHEYVEVIQWLNEKTEIDAYLFTVETIRVDDSRPVPILRKIVGPSRRSRTGCSGGDPKLNQQVRDWWGRVLPPLADVHPAWQSVRPTAHRYPDVSIPGAPPVLSWYVNVDPHTSTVGVKISGSTKDEGDFYFRQLARGQDAIHELLGERLEWDPRTSARGTRWIYKRVSGGFADDPPTQEVAATAIAQLMKSLVAATEEIVREVPRYQSPADDTTAGRHEN